MLPLLPKSLGRLSEVFASALASLSGEQNPLNLPKVKNACVVLVDGLGSANIRERAGHAPFLNSKLKMDGSINCGFPSTTVTSLSSFSTGVQSGQHGMVGYKIVDPRSNETMNLLTEIPSQSEAQYWQPLETIAERALGKGFSCIFIGPGEYDNSGFTMATMRGSTFMAARTIQERFDLAAKLLSEGNGKLIYLYVPELDQQAHAKGFLSAEWSAKLEDLESALRGLVSSSRKDSGILLTADHGIVDVPKEKHFYLDELEIDGLQSVGGDPRVLFLYFDSLPDQSTREKIQKFLGKSAYVATQEELIAAGWFGEVSDFSKERMPQLFVVGTSKAAFYHRSFAKKKSLEMIGQHGSVSPEELTVPLLRFAGYETSN
jgi:predicted AlkP superfamily pyrophosphatase or phosphodiesterase